jgi:hypothetical protein
MLIALCLICLAISFVVLAMVKVGADSDERNDDRD